MKLSFLLRDIKFNRFGVQTDLKKDVLESFFSVMLDVVGSNSLWQEVELVQLLDDSVFSQLGLAGVTI